MNHWALINRFAWPGLPFCALLVEPKKLDNVFFWNDENNLFSSATLTLGPVPDWRNNSIPGINLPYFRDNFIPGINSVPERRNSAIQGINLG